MPSYKIIQSGHILEVYKYQRSVGYKQDEYLCVNGGRDKEGKAERKVEYVNTVNQRARNKIRRLINANFDENSLFITLTYAENMTDVDQGSYDLKKFVQKMKRRQKDFEYVAVIEFMKNGRVHYHMLTNYKCTWNTHAELQSHERALGSVWGHGFVDIGYKKSDNAGAYLIKYMTKENADERLEGKKRYFFSRSLKQPKELLGADAVQALKEFDGLPPVFTSTFFNEFHGMVEHFEFNPKRYDLNNFKRVINENQEKCVNDAVELFGDLVEIKE